MLVSAICSLVWPCRWFPLVVFLFTQLGCGADLPADTGGGIVRGRVYYEGNEIEGLVQPTLILMATIKPIGEREGNYIMSEYYVACRSFPKEGISYELNSLYPYTYFITAWISDFSSEEGWKPFGVNSENIRVKVKSDAPVENVDITVSDIPLWLR